MAAVDTQQVLDVRHWTDRLFSFKTTRDRSFRFENGQFVMLGLPVDGRPLLRAYSMASANYEDTLEFFSIKVPDGPLTSRLGLIREGDEILIGRKPTGTLLQDNLTPGDRLYMVATGTGVAPFVSLIKDHQLYQRFENIILVHGCRWKAELAFGADAVDAVRRDVYLSELTDGRLHYYPTVTREDFVHRGRVTTVLSTDEVSREFGLPPLDAETDRVMICGSPGMLADMCGLMAARGFEEGAGARPAEYVIEKAFVER